jgi:hypothetical protein
MNPNGFVSCPDCGGNAYTWCYHQFDEYKVGYFGLLNNTSVFDKDGGGLLDLDGLVLLNSKRMIEAYILLK